MKIAVCLQTCGRYEYTQRTLETFAAKNDLSRFELLHGDDASDDRLAMRSLVASYGFKTIVQHKTRLGYLPVRTAMIAKAVRRAPWVLLLENDIESVRPFPWPLFEYVTARSWIYCLRLYGAFKGFAETEPCKTTSQWHGGAPVSWKALKAAPEPAEMGRIHWSAQPCITRGAELLGIHNGHRELQLKTARVVDNVMMHIGVERTPGRIRTAVAC